MVTTQFPAIAATPFSPGTVSWNEASPETFEKLFMPGISEGADATEVTWNEDNYLLKPVSGWLEYVRRGESEKLVKEEPAHSAKLHLTAVSLQLSDDQFKQIRRLTEVCARVCARACAFLSHICFTALPSA